MKNDKTSTMNKIDTNQLQKWAKKIHDNAINKGFYDKEKELYFSHNQRLEIVKELCEFHDAWKKDSMKYKEELADVVIRILDYMEYEELEIQGDIFMSEITEKEVYTISKEVYNMAYYIIYDWFMPVIFRCFQLATYLNFDLIEEIENKMQYNTTRPYLHGNKI